jgi:hypothetical protein
LTLRYYVDVAIRARSVQQTASDRTTTRRGVIIACTIQPFAYRITAAI